MSEELTQLHEELGLYGEQKVRIQLRRVKGWRMPPNTVKVDRSTPWGNPFKVGEDGTRDRCVELFVRLMQGYLCVTAKTSPEELQRYHEYVMAHRRELAGKNLACWCPLDAPCHADTLLQLAAQEHK